jgi:hypothetical protein
MNAWFVFVVLGVLLLLCVAAIIYGAGTREIANVDRYGDTHMRREERSEATAMTGLFGGIIVIILLLIATWMAIGPNYRLWRASIEKRIAVEEALAEADAAVELKRAEITRAEGVAEANVIITESIDEQYIRWLYVNNLADHNASEIIYIPTEGGLPILEAGRLSNQGGSE